MTGGRVTRSAAKQERILAILTKKAEEQKEKALKEKEDKKIFVKAEFELYADGKKQPVGYLHNYEQSTAAFELGEGYKPGFKMDVGFICDGCSNFRFCCDLDDVVHIMKRFPQWLADQVSIYEERFENIEVTIKFSMKIVKASRAPTGEISERLLRELSGSATSSLGRDRAYEKSIADSYSGVQTAPISRTLECN